MTDEEMAEQYVKENGKVYYHSNGEPMFTREEDLKFAFLAGLKAGKPEWHDLREDPNDLPENTRNVWCDYGDGCGKGYYNEYDGGWWIEGHLYCSTVVAWCELPSFKE